MELGRSGSGGGKVVTFEDAVAGLRRNGGSLSSYLDIGDKDAAGRAARPPLPAPGVGSRRRTYADGELDVFAAERYFKGAMDGGDRNKEAVVVAGAAAVAPVETAAARPASEAVVIASRRPSSTRASTASFAASSASSANSQTALFRGGRRGGSSGDGRCCGVQVGAFMRTCSGKRSVRVDDGRAAKEAHAHGGGEAAASGVVDWYKELRMQKASLAGDGNAHVVLPPPGLNLGGTAKVAAIGIGREMMMMTREEKIKAAAELACSSSMRRSFTLVAPVRAANNNVPPPASGGGAGKAGGGGGDEEEYDDGGGSESSSDLFEIKSLMIEECCPYEPSEASIQWSVVTADAAEQRGVAGARWDAGGRGPVAAGTGRQQYRDQRPVGLLAGCASHRAVDVAAATTTKAAVPAMQRRGDGFQKARNGG